MDADGQALGRLASGSGQATSWKAQTKLHASRRLWRQCSDYECRQGKSVWKEMGSLKLTFATQDTLEVSDRCRQKNCSLKILLVLLKKR